MERVTASLPVIESKTDQLKKIRIIKTSPHQNIYERHIQPQKQNNH